LFADCARRAGVVLGQVAWLGAREPERLLDASRGVLGDVLVERTWLGAGREDALDGGMLERAERGRMPEGALELLGGVPLAKQQDSSCLPGPRPRSTATDESEELGGALAHAVEGDAKLIEIDGTLSLGWGVQPGRIGLCASAARRELMTGDAA
jgi:hypothetical protein